ncbi:type VI secretion system baseplate subunit TssF [Caballeronia sp. LP006]|jgi:type VI secretion system protein ImpG|uniref:type VI secretion system baseplate subunit TssF n=1 Tax=unclassified Caballeronia TaxID=2646786 RepID=UPI001FD13795|nr:MULTISPECIES: type VI secretion system baseplate subunit TssF [unclassified Caballeronia]MDR5805573.1 type VI secretion system baseplate subunit TssF [Caballeronia sp. LZ001]MDR5826812.1 type VI secretion system baseplate subunit TssF [Caballeronia sp. LP006]
MLNRYYENELTKLKTLAVEFAEANPALAPMLAGRSTDPDVERLLEGVAFLTGLARQKLDDEFPEFIQELSTLLFPHYLRPVPATTMVLFEPRGALTETASVAAGVELASAPVDGTPCRFRTTQAVDVHPLTLAARLSAGEGRTPSIDLDFSLRGLDLARWQTKSLRLFLAGGYSDASKLLMLLMTEVTSVRLTASGVSTELGARSLVPSGFDSELVPYPSHAFPGYRSLQEFFVQPEKFLFLDLNGIDKLRGATGTTFSVTLCLKRLPVWLTELSADAFMLNVTPVINLFEHHANPITLDHRQMDYRVSPEGANRQHYQIHSVDKVTSYRQGVAQQRVYRPFGVLGHAASAATASEDQRAPGDLVYHTSLRPAAVGNETELYLSVAYPPEATPQTETLSIELTCTNRYLPESLRYGDLSEPTSSSPERLKFRNIRPMTPVVNPPVGEALRWRLLGHAALNFLSLADAANLRALLSLYVFSERQEQGHEAANRRRIAGLKEMSVTPEVRLFGRNMLRGQLIRVRCEMDHFAGAGDLYVFGSVLDRFLGAYASMNTYTRFELEDIFSGEVFRWTPRLGQQALL